MIVQASLIICRTHAMACACAELDVAKAAFPTVEQTKKRRMRRSIPRKEKKEKKRAKEAKKAEEEKILSAAL